MSPAAVFAPVLVEMALTFALLFWAGFLRVEAVRRGAVRPSEVSLRQPNWPKQVAQVTNAYQNQLELPILFYVLTILAWLTTKAGTVFIVLAWIFVVTRLLHAAIHVTTNDLLRRFLLFLVGGVVLAAMWAVFAVSLLFGL